jgi:DNA-binding transcriptional regulator YdaS (Cro superfamily)
MYSRALKCAAEILGSTEALRAYLGVSSAQLHLWMDGGIKPPDSVFLKIADLLAEKQSEALRERPAQPEVR